MANTKRKKGISKSKRRAGQSTRRSTKKTGGRKEKEKYPPEEKYIIERRYYTLEQILTALKLNVSENHDVMVKQLNEKDAYRVCIEIYKEKSHYDSYDDEDDEDEF